MKALFHIEHHDLGPRVYVFSKRVHEWQLGLGILIALAIGGLCNLVHDGYPTTIAVLAALYFIYKDWRDIFPAYRDRYAWNVGMHRFPGRSLAPRGDRVPLLAAAVTLLIGLVNLGSALTPNIAWRGKLLLHLDPVDAVPVIHSLTIPASLVLIVTSFYLGKRRERAHHLALAICLLLVAFNLAKGLDFEEAGLSLALAGLLFWAREAFYVRSHPIGLKEGVQRVPLVLLSALFVSYLAVLVAVTGSASLDDALRNTVDFLTLSHRSVPLRHGFVWLPLGVFLIGLLAMLESAYLLFRPRTAPGALPSPELRSAALQLVRSYGKDTLSFFKLRQDKLYLFSDDGEAFIGYRIESGSLLVSGDPVGAEGSISGLLEKVVRFARNHDLSLAVVGASEELRPRWQELGLKSLYMGDEAVIDLAGFSLEGRAIRKVRQSVTRLEKAGYRFELASVASTSAEDIEACERVSAQWRDGRPERGFSMALDTITGQGQEDSLLALARDEQGEIRGFLHIVPSYGREAYSLSFMRRERDTPNGLMEFLVCRTAAALREQGVEELSLNFAAFARFINDPQNPFERLAGRIAKALSNWLQIESLYRFNAKFFPRWVARYYLYEGTLRLVTTGVATLFVEGQIGKPRLPERRSAQIVKETAARNSDRVRSGPS